MDRVRGASSVDADVRACLFGNERKLALNAVGDMSKASEGRVVAGAMTFEIATRRIALLHHVEFRVAVEQTFAVAIVAIRACAPFVVRLADARLDFLDACTAHSPWQASHASLVGGRAGGSFGARSEVRAIEDRSSASSCEARDVE